MKEKIFNYFFVAIIAGGFLGLILSGILGFGAGMTSGVILSVMSFHNFCKEEESDKKKREKETEKQEIENAILNKKYKAEKSKERKERRAWLKELNELHPH